VNDPLPQTIDRFAGLNVLVVGDAMLDSYLEGTSGRLCPEAPVPVVNVTGRRDAPGGAANAAVNARALGAGVQFLALVGGDDEGCLLRKALAARDVSAEHLVVCPARRTQAKQRVVASGQILVRFDQGDGGPLEPDCERALIDRLKALWRRADAVLVSDYGYGVVSARLIETIARLQRRHPRVLVADGKRLGALREVGLTAAKPNYREALALLGLAAEAGDDRAARLTAHGPRVLAETGAGIAAVTLDVDGALVFERGRPPYRTYATPRPPGHAAGAGDTYVAALALAVAAGADTPAAAELAAAAAAVVVAQDGTAACTARELRDRVAGGGKVAADRASLAGCLAEERRRGRRIVFTNGCFDVLHRGHVIYLSRAKALGDLLVVGVNSDEGIRRLKGPTRPLNCLDDRLEVLAALSCVDHLVAFDEDTPHELIRALRPDVFVKGGDYTRDRLPEAALVEELGGVVRILPYLEERSTTGLIERIRATFTDKNAEAASAALDGRPDRPGRVARNGHGRAAP
jgi:D-beta-D-heptose 7-phosphate kinase / D-beta-D-heptose 1-phosphate adenosyltransferase